MPQLEAVRPWSRAAHHAQLKMSFEGCGRISIEWFLILLPDLAAGQDPQRSLQRSITARRVCSPIFFIKHWKYWCGMVWVGSRCPHVSTCFNSQQRHTKTRTTRMTQECHPLGSPWRLPPTFTVKRLGGGAHDLMTTWAQRLPEASRLRVRRSSCRL